MEYEAVARELSALFGQKGYQWRIDGVLTTPTEADILETLKQMDERLANEPSGTWLELGHLIFIKTENLMDVYVHIHTVERNNEQPNS